MSAQLNIPALHGAFPIAAASGNVAATAATATLAHDSKNLMFMTGFVATASGATAALDVNITITGLAVGTLTFAFTFPVGATVGAIPLVVNFPNPLPAADVNTDIILTLPSGGTGNTNASVVAFGLQPQ